MAALHHQGGGLPLEEFTRTVPPRWMPGLDAYPDRLYEGKMRLCRRAQEYDDLTVGAIVASRLGKWVSELLKS